MLPGPLDLSASYVLCAPQARLLAASHDVVTPQVAGIGLSGPLLAGAPAAHTARMRLQSCAAAAAPDPLEGIWVGTEHEARAPRSEAGAPHMQGTMRTAFCVALDQGLTGCMRVCDLIEHHCVRSCEPPGRAGRHQAHPGRLRVPGPLHERRPGRHGERQ